MIEILVVIAIVTVLMAIMLPVLARARAAARQTVCLSNIRQMSLATHLYGQNNNESFGFSTLGHRNAHGSDATACPEAPKGIFISNAYLYPGSPPYNGVYEWMIKRPSETVLLGEGAEDVYDSMEPMYWGDPPKVVDPAQQALHWDSVTGLPKRVAVHRHNGKSNWAFVDHHVKLYKFSQLFQQTPGSPPIVDSFDPLR